MSTANTVSPFRISHQDRDNLGRNEAFRMMREHLRRQELGMKAPRYVTLEEAGCFGYSRANSGGL